MEEIIMNKKRQYTKLTALDIYIGQFRSYQLYIYKRRLNDRMIGSFLPAISVQYPEIAGRLCSSDDGLIYIVHSGNDIPFEVEQINKVMPNYGIGFSIDNDRDSYLARPHDDHSTLFNIKISHFKSGHSILGISWSHALCDATGYSGLIGRWSALCRGEQVKFSSTGRNREKLRKIHAGRVANRSPSWLEEKSLADFGLTRLAIDERNQEKIYKSYKIHGDNVVAFKKLKNSNPTKQWVSTQDLTTAKIWKTIAQAQADTGPAKLMATYNLRRIPGIGIEADYFGNAMTFAETSYDLDSLRTDPILSIAQAIRISTLNSITLDTVRDEFAYLEKYNRSSDRPFLIHKSEIESALGTGTIANNLSTFPIHQFDFGSGPPYWIGGPTRPNRRQFSLYPISNNLADGLILHLNLPRDEMDRFSTIAEQDSFFRVD